jgi:hypothetical protein
VGGGWGVLGQFMETSVGHGQCTKKCCECCCYTPTSALRLFDWSSNLLRPFLFDALAIFINSGPQVLRPQTDAAVQVEEVGAAFVVVAGPWVSIWNQKPIAPNFESFDRASAKIRTAILNYSPNYYIYVNGLL